METTLAINYQGIPLTSQKITPGATATGIGANVLAYNQFTVAYTSGGTTQIVVGDTIVGATSAAVGDVVSITLTGGTWAGGDAAGVITLKNTVGTWTTNENVKVKAGTNDATLTGTPAADTSDYPFKGACAKSVIIQATAQTALISLDGSSPDQTYKKGINLPANSMLTITCPQALRNLKVIDAANGSATVVMVNAFFNAEWPVAG